MNKEDAERQDVGTLNVHEIMELLPHRYPFLMIDRLQDIVLGESAVGTKNVTINEPFFQGHFPAQAVMPGVLIVEAMAQTAAALVMYTLGPEAHGKVVYFMSVDEARFRKPVRSEEHTSELQSLMRISYAVFCLKKKKQHNNTQNVK